MKSANPKKKHAIPMMVDIGLSSDQKADLASGKKYIIKEGIKTMTTKGSCTTALKCSKIDGEPMISISNA